MESFEPKNILLAIVLGIIVNELLDIASWLAYRIVWLMTRPLSPDSQARYFEELTNHLDETPSKGLRLLRALHMAITVPAGVPAADKARYVRGQLSVSGTMIVSLLLVRMLTGTFMGVPFHRDIMFYTDLFSYSLLALTFFQLYQAKYLREYMWLLRFKWYDKVFFLFFTPILITMFSNQAYSASAAAITAPEWVVAIPMAVGSYIYMAHQLAESVIRYPLAVESGSIEL